MSIIRPELARLKSDENAWLKLSVIARRALNWAIDNGINESTSSLSESL